MSRSLYRSRYRRQASAQTRNKQENTDLKRYTCPNAFCFHPAAPPHYLTVVFFQPLQRHQQDRPAFQRQHQQQCPQRCQHVLVYLCAYTHTCTATSSVLHRQSHLPQLKHSGAAPRISKHVYRCKYKPRVTYMSVAGPCLPSKTCHGVAMRRQHPHTHARNVSSGTCCL